MHHSILCIKVYWGEYTGCICVHLYYMMFIYKLINIYLCILIHAFSNMMVHILYVYINLCNYFYLRHYNTVCPFRKLLCMVPSDISLPGIRLSLSYIQGHWKFVCGSQPDGIHPSTPGLRPRKRILWCPWENENSSTLTSSPSRRVARRVSEHYRVRQYLCSQHRIWALHHAGWGVWTGVSAARSAVFPLCWSE